jgi:hypothetical protein
MRVGGQLVTTVLDLVLAQYGVARPGLPGDWPEGYDDAQRPGTPAWQESITGVDRHLAARVAREFARNAGGRRARGSRSRWWRSWGQDPEDVAADRGQRAVVKQRAAPFEQPALEQLISAIAGTIAGAAALIGLLILIYRRARVRPIAVTTSYVDLLVYSLLLLVIVLGMIDTMFDNAASAGNGYDYRRTVSIWFRGVFALQDHAQLMAFAPLVYKLHALSA